LIDSPAVGVGSARRLNLAAAMLAAVESAGYVITTPGRLLPADAETRIEHNNRHRHPQHMDRWVVIEDLTDSEPDDDMVMTRILFGNDAHQVHRTVHDFPDGSRWVGPWLPAPTTEES
jgi:hypothetical protein